jgi:hypothetical protein
MQWKRILLMSFCAIAGAILALIFNFAVIDSIVVPDPCYYHSHDTTWLFDLFYKITSAEGYHPSPSVFNFIFTITAGTAAGIALAGFLLRKNKGKKILPELQF